MNQTCAGRPELAATLRGRGAHIAALPVEQLDQAINDVTTILQGAGVSQGSVVAIEDGDALKLIIGVLATWSLDAVPLPCHVLPDTPLATSMFVFTYPRSVRRPLSTAPVAGLGSTAVLHATSGTTGEPKLAKRGIASVLNESEGYRLGLAITPDDRVYVPVPIVHSYGWGVAIAALMAGARLDAGPAVHARRTARRIETDTTVVALTAPLARVLADVARDSPIRAPRIAIVGASQVTAPLDEAFADRYGTRLWRNYGSSETGATFIGRTGLPDGAIGRPMLGVAITRPQPGQEGELHLRLEAPVEGYLGTTDPATSTWATGDRVRHDQAGVIQFLARLRGTTRLNDRTVDLGGLERILRNVPGVDAVFCLVLPRRRDNIEDLYALVAGAHVDPAHVERRRPSLPEGTQSVRLVYCAKLPAAANGKVDRTQATRLARAEWS